MEKHELEIMLQELDDALVAAFPDAAPLQALVVGGACLLLTEVTSRPTNDIDLIIFDLMGSSEENSLIYTTPLAAKIRRIIMRIGKLHGLKGDQRMFLNDDCAPFLLEIGNNELPEMRLWGEYQKLRLYIPDDLSYILACKFMAGRPDKDFRDTVALCQLLGVQTRDQAQEVVDRFFPSKNHQSDYNLPATLDIFFPEDEKG